MRELQELIDRWGRHSPYHALSPLFGNLIQLVHGIAARAELRMFCKNRKMEQHKTNRSSRLPVETQNDVIGQFDTGGRFVFGKEDLQHIGFLIVDQTNRCAICLLYTSDAADERSSVDLGGRRIIKKKTRTVKVEHK